MHLILLLSLFAQANVFDELDDYKNSAPPAWGEHRSVEQPRSTPRQSIEAPPARPERSPSPIVEKPTPPRIPLVEPVKPVPAARPPLPPLKPTPPVVERPLPEITPRVEAPKPTLPSLTVPRALALPTPPPEAPRTLTLTPRAIEPSQPIPIEAMPLPPTEPRPPTVRLMPPEPQKPRQAKPAEIVITPQTPQKPVESQDDGFSITVSPQPRNPKPRPEIPAEPTPAAPQTFRPGLGGYPFLRGPYRPVLGNGSHSFVFTMSRGIKDQQMFDRFLSDATNVCDPTNNPATGNIPCSLWNKGETFLIFESADTTAGIEMAYFQLISVPPRELVTFCDGQPSTRPCISGRASQSVYPHHGPQNPKTFSLYIDETKDESRILLSRTAFANNGNLSIVLDPVVPSEGLLMSTLNEAFNNQQIGMKVYYKGKFFAQGYASRCEKQNCGLMIIKHSTTPEQIPTKSFRDLSSLRRSGDVGLP